LILLLILNPHKTLAWAESHDKGNGEEEAKLSH